jgi:MSHA biogenesis protein MshE
MATTLLSKSLGEALIEQGWLTSKQLSDALQEQKRTGQKLGQVLIDNNFVSDEQIARVLAAQQNLPFIDLRRFSIQRDKARLLGEMQARKYRAVLLEERRDTYLVAISDPFNLAAQDALSGLLKRPIEYAVVSNDQLSTTIDHLYLKDEQLTEFARAIESDVDRDANIINLNRISTTVDDADAPVVKLLQTVFREASQLRASDIHFEAQEKKLVVRFRIDGALHTHAEADLKIAPPLVVKLKLMAGLDIAEKRLPQDGRISVRTDESRQLDIRMSTMPTQYGESVVLRILMQSQGIRDLEALGMSEDVYKRFLNAINTPNGIVLATGPTGSGKTTTLYGALTRLNSPEVKILTCEDPVEYRIGGISQVQVNDKIGLTFPTVLRSFLRQDPDVLLVGEIRDGETAEIAVRAAMTGHLVLSTLHTNDAVSTPARLLDMGIPGFMIATTLRAVLSQRLLRLVCTECAEPYTPLPEEQEWIRHYYGEIPASATLQHGAGCQHCNGSGYHGRLGIYELLDMTQKLAMALHTNNPVQFEAVAREQIGHGSLMHQGFALAFQGRTTVSEVIKNSLITE